ncbi:MAG: glycosyltransferase family 39 protein [Saprospiraceae bacterium]|nr:glycosyltransferase family 39 protein [Saprospiraceae bacterium]
MKLPFHSTVSNFFLHKNWLPFAAVAVAALGAQVFDFNGLYGQDAHELLRQSRVFYQHFWGAPYVPQGRGDVELAVGYPLAGAVLRLLGPDSILALQLVSGLAAGSALWAFDFCLRVLTPGAHRWSRQLYAGVALALSAYFVRAGVTVMSDALGLAFTLFAAGYGMRAVEGRRGRDAVGAAAFMGLAVLTRFALAPLLAPLAIGVGVALIRVPPIPGRRDWNFGWLVLAVLAGLTMLAPHFWLKTGMADAFLGHSLLREWSAGNLFRASFSTGNGLVEYRFPNLVYLFFPLAHPGYLLPLPLLFFLTKRTDFLLPAKKVLMVCLAVYLSFLGGLPVQNVRYLLPAYAFLLLLLFPAWDRFVSYGFYFFKKLTTGLVLGAIGCQLFFTVQILLPVWERNRLEREVAEGVKEVRDRLGPSPSLHPSPHGEGSGYALGSAPLPLGGGVGGGAIERGFKTASHPPLYTFDLDLALRSYLPDWTIYNLWAERYETYPVGGLILFNEPRLRRQWEGRNPMLNWDFVVGHYELREVAVFSEGWTLYEIVKPK